MHEGLPLLFITMETLVSHCNHLAAISKSLQINCFSVICGISEDTTSAHIVKAALQSVCFQIRDILEAMKEDTGLVLSKLLVDGAMTTNGLLMQMQADICGIPVGK